MKKLKDYVCTFGQAKRFKMFCVCQDSLFYYNETGKLLKQPQRSFLGKISAYTSQEIMEIAKGYKGAIEHINSRMSPESRMLIVVEQAMFFIEYLDILRARG